MWNCGWLNDLILNFHGRVERFHWTLKLRKGIELALGCIISCAFS